MNQIGKGVISGLKQLGEETGKELISETGKIAESIITGKELLGDIVPMSNQEMEQKRIEDEKKKEEEISDVRYQISGRNVEGEMEQVRREKQQIEDEKEKMFLENLKRQREEERMEMEVVVEPPSKKRSRGDAFARRKVNREDTSRTKEFVKKPD